MGRVNLPPLPRAQLVRRTLVEDYRPLTARAHAEVERFVGLEAVSRWVSADHFSDRVDHKIGGVLLETEPLCGVASVAGGRANKGALDGVGDPEIASAILGYVRDRVTGDGDRDGQA